MPSILSEDDKQTVKRTVSKPSNKIHAVAVARLYVAYPDRSRWSYTGLQGAVVLANDLVGNTMWIKLVDISPSNRGVIWDQEIYDTLQYNQDRTFFHTFELEECLAGLSFVDEKEAKTFKKKIDEREKNAHKNTRSKPFSVGAGAVSNGQATTQEKHHHGLFGGLFGGHRHSSASHESQSAARSRTPTTISPTNASSRESIVDTIDPKLRKELAAMGITEDQLANNYDFIMTWIAAQKKAEEETKRTQRGPAPPPPPPSAPPASRVSPQNTGSTLASQRGSAPAPPPPRRGARPIPTIDRAASPSPTRQQPLPPPGPRFQAPPPLADAGKFAHDDTPSLPMRSRATSAANTGPTSGPPPPPRPPKTPVDAVEAPAQAHKFAIPPPFQPAPPPRTAVAPPPQPPSRSNLPPPPPFREPSAPPAAPPLPPKNDAPPLPAASSRPSAIPPPPPLPPSNAPAPPPLPPSNAPIPPPLPPMSNVPPPPPLPSNNAGAPPPPGPPPPPRASAAPAAPVGALLSDIRGGARLRKVSEADKNDRSKAQVPGQEVTSSAGPSGSSGADGGGLAGALANALAARKSKVSHSDDEDDKDDW